jgi:hypothetical protein
MPFFDDSEDPYSTHTVMGWIRSWKLGQALEAGYNDHAGIQADYEASIAAEQAQVYPPQSAAEPAAEVGPEVEPVAEPMDITPDPEPEAEI